MDCKREETEQLKKRGKIKDLQQNMDMYKLVENLAIGINKVKDKHRKNNSERKLG